MPLGEDQLLIRTVSTHHTSGSVFQILFCQPDISVCGRRETDSDRYEEDSCWGDVDGSDVDIRFKPTGFSNGRIEAGTFASSDFFDDDGYERIRCNDLPYALIDRPADFLITAPTPDLGIQRSAQSNIRVEWSPGGTEFPMRWKLIPLDDELELLPCDMLPWESFEQQGPDMGFGEIPMDIIPANLPPEGCEVILTVSRTKDIALPEGISQGSITSSVIDGLVFRILP